MAISISSPITGSAQTGFTSPTYTIVADSKPSIYANQWYVSALGGTQTGASAHSIALPFTTTIMRPQKLQTLPPPNQNGVIPSFPVNTFRVLSRKGMAVSANAVNPARIGSVDTVIKIPAGADTVSPAELRAMLSSHIGALTQVSAALGDACITGAFT